MYATFVAVLMGAIALATVPPAGAEGATKTFIMHPTPKPVAAISFADGRGKTRSLRDFKNKVVVLNVWATWCVPCRTEMPTLDRLQAVLGGADFEVVPVSIDRGGLEVVSKFYAEIGMSHIAKYSDISGQILRTVGAVGLPTTLIIDRAGNEAGRVVGPAEWDASEVVELLKSVTMRPSNASAGDVAGGPPAVAPTDTRGMFARGVSWLKALFK